METIKAIVYIFISLTVIFCLYGTSYLVCCWRWQQKGGECYREKCGWYMGDKTGYTDKNGRLGYCMKDEFGGDDND